MEANSQTAVMLLSEAQTLLPDCTATMFKPWPCLPVAPGAPRKVFLKDMESVSNQNQNGQSLEDYVEEYYHETLKQRFWSGMDDILGQMLLLGEDRCPFIEFINYPLWVCGSSIPWESLRTTTPLTRTPQDYLSSLKRRHIILAWSVPETRGVSSEEAREAVPPRKNWMRK
ncbi:hypothetical protein DPX16_19377 [Anabarilius grahami]|uniref:Uncharacterized protein n=1 Tax=Anabarilius grahami TaxID=495550 RepID=A0A3N0Z1R1_ANAGA|nr:hypothetical protein DPX16_19377 [Anabarilius grahami]